MLARQISLRLKRNILARFTPTSMKKSFLVGVSSDHQPNPL